MDFPFCLGPLLLSSSVARWWATIRLTLNGGNGGGPCGLYRWEEFNANCRIFIRSLKYDQVTSPDLMIGEFVHYLKVDAFFRCSIEWMPCMMGAPNRPCLLENQMNSWDLKKKQQVMRKLPVHLATLVVEDFQNSNLLNGCVPSWFQDALFRTMGINGDQRTKGFSAFLESSWAGANLEPEIQKEKSCVCVTRKWELSICTCMKIWGDDMLPSHTQTSPRHTIQIW